MRIIHFPQSVTTCTEMPHSCWLVFLSEVSFLVPISSAVRWDIYFTGMQTIFLILSGPINLIYSKQTLPKPSEMEKNVSIKDGDKTRFNFNFQEELGLKYVPSAIPMLKQASCYGNQDAAFMLSVVLNYGLVVKSHEIKVLYHFP